MLHGMPRFEGSEYSVGVDGRAAKNLITEGIREGVQNGGAPTSDRRLAHTAITDRRFRIWNVDRSPLHIDRHIQNCWRLVLVEARRKHGAVVRVVHPLLANRMSNAENRSAKHLAAQRAGMNYGANIGVGEEIHDVIFARFDINLDLGKAGNVGECRAIARVIVLRGRQKALARERRRRRLSPPVEVGRYFVAIVDAAELNRVLRGLRQSHAGASAVAKYALVGNIIILRLAAELIGCNLLEFLPGIHRGRIGSACHCVGRLASAGNTGERKVLRRVAPYNIALLPRHSENFGSRAMHVDHRFRSEVADSGLEVHTPIRLDNEETIEADRATDETTQRNPDAAHLRSDPFRRARDPLAPFELFCPAVEGFLEERARRVGSLALRRRSERRFAFRTIDSADGDLVEFELARRFRSEEHTSEL